MLEPFPTVQPFYLYFTVILQKQKFWLTLDHTQYDTKEGNINYKLEQLKIN